MTEELDKKIREIANNYVSECWGTYLDLSDVDLVQAGIGVALAVTKELQEELKKWKDEWQEQVQKATDEGYARTQLQIENGNLKKQIEKMKCCANCCNWYKGMRDENNYPCDQHYPEHLCSLWELEE